MALKEIYDLVFDSSVNAGATDAQLSGIVPIGKTVRLLNFGGFDPLSSDQVSSIISIQWGSAAGWSTIRAGGNGVFDIVFDKGKDFTGDGVKRFRLIRQNKSSIGKVLVVWASALIIN